MIKFILFDNEIYFWLKIEMEPGSDVKNRKGLD